MKSEWMTKQLSEIVNFNPSESLPKGTKAKKISMDMLQPYCRDVPIFEVTAYTGGTKFRNGDTIMARITPCLENGKTAQINILGNNEVGFGSTEYIVFRAKEDVSVPDYIYYLVRSPFVREPAIKSMVGSSGRQRVQTDVVMRLEVQVPPLEEQQKIAGILRVLDDKIKLNNEINKNLAA
jgi:type I restriction enzyme S subunit